MKHAPWFFLAIGVAIVLVGGLGLPFGADLGRAPNEAGARWVGGAMIVVGAGALVAIWIRKRSP